MLRVNRYFIPGHVWHVTHRCHRWSFGSSSPVAGNPIFLMNQYRF